MTISFCFLCLALFVTSVLSQIPGPGSIYYLTNCNTASGEVSQVAFYFDQSQSKNGQTPDQAITSSDVKTWEGTSYTWTITDMETIHEQINSGANDPSVPTYGFSGCGDMVIINGGAAVRFQYNCFKDNARVLYSTSDITCISLYFCQYRTEGGDCPGPVANQMLVDQSNPEF